MNGFIKKTATLFVGVGLTSLVGCCCYPDLVDPCWPERYNTQARHSVIHTTNAQAHNGHVLDQTVWNWYFDTEIDPKTKQPVIDPATGRPRPSARLNAAGLE